MMGCRTGEMSEAEENQSGSGLNRSLTLAKVFAELVAKTTHSWSLHWGALCETSLKDGIVLESFVTLWGILGDGG